MKNVGKKGFTLVELLAVITIMGILMLVAIPAVSRTIENSRRDTFMDTAKAYINAIKNAVAADELSSGSTPISALGEGYYYYKIESDLDSGKDLMEQGGKSSWGNTEVKGFVVIYKAVGDQGRTTYEYAIKLVDMQGRGVKTLTTESALKRSSVSTSGTALTTNSLINKATIPGKATTKIKFNGFSSDVYISDESGSLTNGGTSTSDAIKCTALTIG